LVVIWKKYILLILLFLLSYQAYQYRNYFSFLYSPHDKDDQGLDKLQYSTKYITYMLDDKKWVNFDLHNRVKQVRIVSYLCFGAEKKPPWDSRVIYTVHYQILNSSDEVVWEKRHFLRTKVQQYKHDILGTVEKYFFLDRELIPIPPKTIILNLDLLPGETRKLRIKSLIRNKRVKNIAIRIMMQHRRTLSDSLSEWRFLPDNRKETLARGNIFPFQFLKDQEKRILIQNAWIPFGPSGSSEDFEKTTLYRVEDVTVVDYQKSFLPKGLFIKGNHHGIVHVPEEGGMIQFEFTPTQAIYQQFSPRTITIKWYGKGIDKRKTFVLPWDFQKKAFSVQLEKGLVDIHPSEELIVRAFVQKKDDLIEITPTKTSVMTYITGNNLPITYQTTRTKSRINPFKINLRKVVTSSGNTSGKLRYTISNKWGSILKKGVINFENEVSYYDYIKGDKVDPISEPVSYYWGLGRAAHFIKFDSTEPFLISAYTRPDYLIRKQRVPEDYLASTPKEEKQYSWFLVNPVNQERLMDKELNHLVYVQRRPPKDDELIKEGLYKYESLEPTGNWLANYIFPIGDKPAVIRDTTLSVMFHEIPSNQKIRAKFKSPDGLEEIRAKLVFLHPKGSDGVSVGITIDGILTKTEELWNDRGEVTLPVLTPGEHDIKIVGVDQGRYFINSILSINKTTDQVYFKRYYYLLNEKGLEFNFNKLYSDKESLTGVYYSINDDKLKNNNGKQENSTDDRLESNITSESDRSIITVNIKPTRTPSLKLATSWTFIRREFTIVPDQQGSTPVLNSNVNVGEAQKFFVTLGDDIPIGNYQITVKINNGRGYFGFYNITPGKFDQTRIKNR